MDNIIGIYCRVFYKIACNFLIYNHVFWSFFIVCTDVLLSDLAFFLDTSASVGEDNFNKTKKFIETIVKYFEVSPARTHVSVSTYAKETKIEFDFLEHTTEKSLFEAIDKIGYRKGTATFIDSALVSANEQVFTPQNKARDYASQVNIAPFLV